VKLPIDITGAPEQWRALGDGFRVGVRIVTHGARVRVRAV